VTLGWEVGRWEPWIVIAAFDALGKTETMTGTCPVAPAGAGPKAMAASPHKQAATTRRLLRSCNMAITS
jgi:hypothetical protein